MDQSEFIDAMKAGLYSGYLGGGGNRRHRARAVFAWLSAVVPIVARCSILGGAAYLGYMAYENFYVLLFAAAAILWVSRGQLSRFMSFGNLLGSASFMTIAQMKREGMFGTSGLILGRAMDMKPRRLAAFLRLVMGPPGESEGLVREFLHAMSGGRLNVVRVRDQPLVRLLRPIHTILVGPAGSGKNVSYVFPTVLTYEHSMVILDPKSGENFKVTADARKAMGQRILRLDPFSECGEGGHKLNVLDLLQADSPMLLANARQLASSIIPKTGNEKDGLHFLNLAEVLLTALILYVVCHAPAAHQNLNLVRYLASDLDRMKKSFKSMKESRHVGGILAEMGSSLDSIYEKEFSSVVSTLGQHLAFLADPLVAEHVGTSTFDVRAATRDTTTYCILPAKLMSTPYSALMKLWLNAFILVKKDEGLDESNELMLMLDEVGNLGRLACLQDAVTVGRGMGIRAYFVLQALSQIEANFDKPIADAIVASCNTKIFIGVTDLLTAKVVSDMAGTATITAPSHNEGDNRSGGGSNGGTNYGSNRGRSYSPQSRKILMEDEVLRSLGTAYVFISGRPPMALSPVKYYEDRAFQHFHHSALRPTPSIYSWACALGGLYFALPIAWDLMPPLPRWNASPKIRHSDPAPVVPAVLQDWMVQQPRQRHSGLSATPPAPRWPSVAICPRCEGRFDLPPGYNGQVLQCPDCPALFRVPQP